MKVAFRGSRWLYWSALVAGAPWFSRAPAQSLAIWTPPHWEVITDTTSPDERPPHVIMVGGRNGMASGLVVVRGPDVLEHARVAVTDLRHEAASAVLPASLITIRYASPFHRDRRGAEEPSGNGAYMHLSTAPLPRTRTLVSRLTASIPPNAVPGVYRGRVHVEIGSRLAVPLTLIVGKGVLPPPREYVTHANFLHSPDSVALRYGVEMWSADHWKLLEASWRLLGQAGQKVLHVPVILHTRLPSGELSRPNHFGSRQGLIRFRIRGRQVEPDFTVFDQFTQGWDRWVGPPQFVVLYVWDQAFRKHEVAEGVRAVITGVEANGQVRLDEVPYPGTEGSEPLWRAVIEGARDRVRRLGWDPRSVILGIAHDHKPAERTVRFFNQITGGMGWNVISHMRGYAPPREGEWKVGELRIAYHEFPWNPVPPAELRPGQLLGGWKPAPPVASLARFHHYQSANGLSYRWLAEGTVGNLNMRNGLTSRGFSRFMLDFWRVPVVSDSGRKTFSTLLVMDGMVNLMRNHLNLATAGPQGAEPSVYLQNIIEGIQDTEARIQIEKALDDSTIRQRLPSNLVERAHKLVGSRARFLALSREKRWAEPIPDFDPIAHSRELYDVLGEIQAIMGAVGRRTTGPQ